MGSTIEIIKKILDRWEELREDKLSDLSAEEIVDQDEDLQRLVADRSHVLSEANEKINKLRRFDSKLGIAKEAQEPHFDVKPLGEPKEKLHAGLQVDVDADLVIEREINRGGLGIIYSATDRVLQRRVAVKISNESSHNGEACDSLRQEAIVIAQLDHPGIAPLYGIGMTKEDEVCYSMRLIEGEELEEAINDLHHARSKRTDWEFQKQLRTLLRSFIAICQTLQHAHDRGVVHCDVKPRNIRVGEYGETVLLDWGEAVAVSRNVKGPRVHMGKKTPGYSAPELQFGYRPTPACDVYSAGVMLMRIVTGKDSLKGNEIGTPAALLSICKKATSEKPLDRYQRIDSLGADVQAWLDHDDVSVHRDSWFEWSLRMLSRYDFVARLALVAGIAMVLVLGLALALTVNNNRVRTVAQRNSLILASGIASDRVADEFEMRWQALRHLSERIGERPLRYRGT